MPSDIHEAANTTKEGWIAWFCPLKLYRHYSGCRIWSGLLYRNYIKLYVSFCAARPGFVAYLFVVQYTTAVLYRCFYIRFVLPLIKHRPKTTNTFFCIFLQNENMIRTASDNRRSKGRNRRYLWTLLSRKSRLRQRRLVYRPHFTFLEK